MDKTILNYLTPKADTFYLHSNSTIRQALEKLDYYKFTVIPLINEDGKYYGTIAEGDILRYIKNDCHFDFEFANHQRINQINVYRPYAAISISSSLEEVLKLSLDQNFIPVVDDLGNYIGIIKRKDIIQDFIDKNK